MSRPYYKECIEACQECAAICNRCAYSCLKSDDVFMMRRCILLNLECAVLCNAAAQVMSLNGELLEELCQLCEDISNQSAEECEKHSKMEYCRQCAETCRKCAEICANMVEHA